MLFLQFQFHSVLKILVNTRLLIKDKMDGIGWFAYETLSLITRQHPEHEFIFVFDRPYDYSMCFSPNVTPVVVPPQARHPLLYIIWFELVLPLVIRRYKPDIFLSPDGFIPLRTKTPVLAVIHDLNFEHNPQDLPWCTRSYYRWFFPRFAAKATRIATVSAFSKADIAARYNIPASKVDVVYNGASEGYKPLSPEAAQEVRNMHSRGLPYFLFVGSLHPRKNLENLFRAFDIFRKNHPQPYVLLIVGNRKWWTPGIQRTYEKMSYRDDVIFTGRLTPGRLHRATAAAFAMVYVSLFEGFGIPLLEAMYCDVPVITSNVTSMPEVAGDAALLANPREPAQIASAMQALATDENLRQSLIQKGRRRRELFSWQKSADRLWDSIRKTFSTTNVTL